MRPRPLLLLLGAAASVLGCEPALQESAPPPPPGAGKVGLRGAIATFSAGFVTLTVELEAADALERTGGDDIRATGILVPASGPRIALTGSYDPATGALLLANASEQLTAARSETGLEGGYLGASGDGAFGLQPDAPGLEVFCGTGSSESGSLGSLVLLVGADAVNGGLATSLGAGPLSGSSDGERVLFGFASGSGEGTLTGEGGLNGTYLSRGSDGTFSASVDRCP